MLTAAIKTARAAFAVGALTVATAASAAAQTPVPSGNDFVAMGGRVFIRYLGSDVQDLSTLSYRVGAFNAGASDYTNLFVNNGPGASPVGQQIELFGPGNSPIAAGQTIVFRLFNQTRGLTFYSGAASRNPDGTLHVGLTPGSGMMSPGGAAYTQGFNFEDQAFGGNPPADGDYNDLRFEVANAAVIPEPGTWMLMGTGLLGLAGAAVRRRKALQA
jgi:hypothetical protein